MTAHAKYASRWLIAGALLGGMLPWSAFADPVRSDEAVALPELANAWYSATVVARVAAPTPFAQAPITGDALDEFRGGTEIVTNENFLDGVVGDNHASNLVTGSNLITEGSFAGANGLSSVIQNSGNNVLIQNSTIVNLQVK
ncbi:MAG: hypothetical protein ABI478_01730 [Propionivibrio sp.]